MADRTARSSPPSQWVWHSCYSSCSQDGASFVRGVIRSHSLPLVKLFPSLRIVRSGSAQGDRCVGARLVPISVAQQFRAVDLHDTAIAFFKNQTSILNTKDLKDAWTRWRAFCPSDRTPMPFLIRCEWCEFENASLLSGLQILNAQEYPSRRSY